MNFFDFLSYGHINILECERKLSEYLIGVLSTMILTGIKNDKQFLCPLVH